MNDKLDVLEEALKNIESKQDTLHNQISELEKRIRKVENDLWTLRSDLDLEPRTK